MLKNLLNKLIKLAGHKLAKYVLAVWCFLENIFFPFPSDAIVIPMSIAKPKRWFETFMIATAAAFVGALVAYAIGNFMFHKLGVHIFELSGVDDPKKFLAIFYKKSTMITFAFILFISGFTPLPFNLLAIASGFVHFNFPLFKIFLLHYKPMPKNKLKDHKNHNLMFLQVQNLIFYKFQNKPLRHLGFENQYFHYWFLT